MNSGRMHDTNDKNLENKNLSNKMIDFISNIDNNNSI
jgi:hypothetical protein